MTEDEPNVAADDRLADEHECLYRQVHPSWVVDGVPSSQAFKPTKKDHGMLSIALGSETTAEGAFLHHTQKLGKASVGAWAVTVQETTRAGLSSYPQPLADSPAHGFIDFRELSRRQAETKAKLLLGSARARGRLHPPPE